MCTSLRIRGADGRCLPMTSFDANIDIQLATAFVTINADFIINKNGSQVLEMPMGPRSTVTLCSIESYTRAIQTCMVSKSELDNYLTTHKSIQQRTIKVDKTLFNIPFEGRKKDKTLHVHLTYYESLTFDSDTGKYSFVLPSTFSEDILSKALTVHIQASINATHYFQWNSVSHSLRISQDVSPTHKVFECDRWENKDFEISYMIKTPEILCSLLLNDPGIDPFDNRATFCLNIHPPPDSSLSFGFFGRRIIFLIDVSGSMSGDPIEQAKKALHTGLTQLRHFWDHFNIIAFNQSMVHWMNDLVEANPQSIEAAMSWVSRLAAGGGTNIMAPMQSAAALLSNPTFTDTRIPMIFLLTDGAVSDEQAIHAWVLKNCTSIRVHTIGIGDFCNAYFLKLIAMAGRGLNDHVSNPKHLYQQVLSLLRSATTPILTNIEVLLPVQSHEYEVFPYPLPDLFCGQPLVISGKVSAPFDHALVRGLLPNGSPFVVTIPPLKVPIQLHKIFVKQRLDYMIGQAWLTGSPEAVNAVVKLSCLTSMPTPYTVMVAYETPLKKKPSNNQLSAEEIAMISVGGILLLVGLAFTFGDVVGTVANVAIDAMFISNVFSSNGSSGCGNCGNCGSCGDCGCNCNCDGCGDSCCNHDHCCDGCDVKCDLDCGNCFGGCCDCGDCNGCCDCGDCGGCDCGDCGGCDCGGC